jgi:hypothetical protein
MSFFQSIFADANDSADVYNDWYQIDIDLEKHEKEVSKWWDSLTPDQKRIVYPFTLYNDGDVQFIDVIPEGQENFEIATRKELWKKHKNCDVICYEGSNHEGENGITITKDMKGWFSSFQRFMEKEPMMWGEGKWWQQRFVRKEIPPKYPLYPAFYRKFCHLERQIRERIVEKYVCTKRYVPQPAVNYDEYGDSVDKDGNGCPELPDWTYIESYNTKEIKEIMKLGDKFHIGKCGHMGCIDHD